jgi:hypothetical protein
MLYIYVYLQKNNMIIDDKSFIRLFYSKYESYFSHVILHYTRNYIKKHLYSLSQLRLLY